MTERCLCCGIGLSDRGYHIIGKNTERYCLCRSCYIPPSQRTEATVTVNKNEELIKKGYMKSV